MIKKIDLSGKWHLFLDENMKDEKDYKDFIILPNTTSNARKGTPNPACETGFLTDAYKFEGNAWFSRKIKIPALENNTVKLFLERTRITTVFVNGKNVGTQDSFVAPHIYDITDLISVGENTIEICVCNTGYKTGGGHMTSQDTQSNWNGITGEISLRIYNNTYAENIFVESDIETKTLKISAEIVGEKSGSALISCNGIYGNEQSFEKQTFDYQNGKLSVIYKMENSKMWSEFEPNLYSLKIEVDGDIVETIVGLREFKASDNGDKFTINGIKTFLRGKHDGLIFPKTGYAPTSVDEWLDVMKTSQDYGMNHYRFHTCCPPEAAFIAADILGIYMEPQLPFWGTITTEKDEKHNKEEQDFLIEEGFRIIKEFGNHPSFCMMSMGNELWGDHERINDILGGYKAIDKRHMYTQGSNNFQWFPNVLENDDFFVGVRLANDRLIRGSYAMCDAPLGHIQTDRPSTMHDYDDAVIPKKEAAKTEASADGTVKIQYGTTMKEVKASDADADFIPKVPIVTHEIGQFETYPNFNEIEKYTGPLKARNFEVFRKRLEEKGMLGLADKFFKSSGKLAMACYKEEMEAVLRSKTIAGFQILDIQDFSGQGTALVGVLDAFMDNKGLITDKEWRNFCSETVLLARFSSYTYESGESFNAHIEITDFSAKSLDKKTLTCKVTGDKFEQISKDFIINHRGENYISVGDFSFEIPEITKPQKLLFEIYIDETNLYNSYDLWIYPNAIKLETNGVFIFDKLNKEANELLESGKTVLIVPNLSELENSIEGFYCADFWCYHMFKIISEMMKKPNPVGTMGLLINNNHPALSEFTSEDYSTQQWWEIVQNSRSEILDDSYEGKNIIVQTIDNFERNHVLGLLYEYSHANGKVVVCNVNFDAIIDKPEGKQFIKSILGYCKNK
ncbi:MAG: beta-glucuronidase [Clostridiales bacterium]|nr:beta-glucuronidase [Clostridiales bacterium]